MLGAVSPHGKVNPYKERCANFYSDPRYQELNAFTTSHKHEDRLREAAELELREQEEQGKKKPTSPTCGMRLDGCTSVDQRMKQLAAERVSLPKVGSSTELPESFRSCSSPGSQPALPEAQDALFRRMDKFQTRLQWRHNFDRSLKRLLTDMELAVGDADNQRESSLKSRCEHLDKIHSWFERHGKKEVRKEREPPGFLQFNPNGPVWNGSLRVAPRGMRDRGSGLTHSASSPTLQNAGSMGLDVTQLPHGHKTSRGGTAL